MNSEMADYRVNGEQDFRRCSNVYKGKKKTKWLLGDND